MTVECCPPLIYGFDTVEIAYFLRVTDEKKLDFDYLMARRDSLKALKLRHILEISLGSESFALASHGTQSGYPILLTNEAFSIQCGPTNDPSFFVTFSSIALWHEGIENLHLRFLTWAKSIGLEAYKPESVSRVDYAVDFHLPIINFGSDNFVSKAVMDVRFRKNGQVQTFKFGQDSVVLRVYNKSDEIKEQSGKFWLHPLWGMESDVWRVEFQLRKEVLREFGIIQLAVLLSSYGRVLLSLSTEHTRLAISSSDSNRSRWQLHPLWESLQDHYETLPVEHSENFLDRYGLLSERFNRSLIAMMGYAKRLAAIRSLQNSNEAISFEQTLMLISRGLRLVHDPLTWNTDVERRMTEMRLGQ